MIAALQLVGGLVALYFGADWLVRGASRTAVALGISPFIVGLTVVAFATSAPETAVAVISTLQGQPDLAFGNVLGSNIFNVLVILGATALMRPVIVTDRVVRTDVPLMIGAALLVTLLAVDGRLDRGDGVLLVLAQLSYITFLWRRRAHGRPATADDPAEARPGAGAAKLALNLLLLLVGLGVLLGGSRLLVEGAVTVALHLGLSELIIGLTIVAGGTGLPEVAASVVAALRGEQDLAVGNIVGSCVFNLLGALGLAALAGGGALVVSSAALWFDLPVMLAACLACLPIFFTGSRIDRWEGGVLVAYYMAYVAYLVLQAQSHDALATYSTVMLLFVAPLTLLTLTAVVLRDFRRSRHR